MMCLLACDQNAGYPLKTYLNKYEHVSYNEYYLFWEEMFRYNQVNTVYIYLIRRLSINAKAQSNNGI